MPAHVEGLNQVVRDLVKTGHDVDDIKDAFAQIATEGAAIAATFAPKRSGALAGTVRGNRAKNKAVITAGKKKTPYAGAINYGWKKKPHAKRQRGGWPIGIRPALFMQKADKAMEEKAPKLIDEALTNIIEGNNLA